MESIIPLEILWPDELPENLSGKIAVVIDVFAATSNMVAFLDVGVGNLYLANDDNVILAKVKYPDAYVVGESNNPEIAAILNASNYPALLEQNKVFGQIAGKTVLYLTINGTKVISQVLENGAERVITASFINLDKVVEWLQKQTDEKGIIIVPSGERTFKEGEKWRVLEDKTCADALTVRLNGGTIDMKEIRKRLGSFIEEEYGPIYQAENLSDDILQKDVEIILELNRTPLVPLCTRRNDGLVEVKRWG